MDDLAARARLPIDPSRPLRAVRLLALALLVLLGLGLAGCESADPGTDPQDPPVEEEEPTPEDPTPEDPTPEDPTPGDPTPGDPTPVDPTPSELSVTLELVADGFTQPLGVVTSGSGSDLHVMQQGGLVRVVRDGTLLDDPFLDGVDEVETGREAGLLGMAFDPDGNDVFVHYTRAAATPSGLESVLARLSVGDAGAGDLASGTELLTIAQPATMHNGGQLAFDDDGMLYMALGDGGTGGDLARDPSDPLGAILRMDVAAGDLVPADGLNPFAADGDGHPLVWHYGLRNPWRFSFDAETGDLWIADVGEQQLEEVNLVRGNAEAGLDFGWNALEGDVCYAVDECMSLDTTLPAFTYAHPEGEDAASRSITGGYVYRGDAMPSLEGAYVYGDFLTGTVWAARASGDGDVEVETLLETDHMISSFGVDAASELLVVDYGGAVLRIVPEEE